MRKSIFFDLDGTLLPIDMDEFLEKYMHAVSEFGAPHSSYELIQKGIWEGYKHMLRDVDPNTTVAEKFFGRFFEVTGLDPRMRPMFDEFYQVNFDALEHIVHKRPQVKEAIDLAKQKGYRLVLATNPVLPRVSTEKRIRWAGLECDDFEFISFFEEMHYCKPNLEYFGEVLEKTGLSPEECIMIGNDVQEDLCAQKLGFDVFFCTEFGIDRADEPGDFPSGDYDGLYEYINKLPVVC